MAAANARSTKDFKLVGHWLADGFSVFGAAAGALGATAVYATGALLAGGPGGAVFVGAESVTGAGKGGGCGYETGWWYLQGCRQVLEPPSQQASRCKLSKTSRKDRGLTLCSTAGKPEVAGTSAAAVARSRTCLHLLQVLIFSHSSKAPTLGLVK